MIARWRIRPRFTLAALLVLITVVTIPLSYVAQRRAWNLRRKAAWEQLRKAGYELYERWIVVSNQPALPRYDPFGVDPPREAPKWTMQGWWNDLCLESSAPQISSIELGVDPFGRDDAIDPQKVLILLDCLPELTELRIQDGEGIDDRALTSIESLPNLRVFHLERASEVRGDFLAHLRSTKLEALTLRELSNLERFSNLAQFSNLRTLELGYCDKITDESLRDVEVPSSLVTLTIVSSGIGDATLSRWLQAVRLEDLHLEAAISRRIAPALARQTELRDLRIFDAPLRDEDLRFLSECELLNTLILQVMPIRGDFFASLRSPDLLKTVTLNSTLLSDKNLGALRRFGNLQRLELDWTPISGEGFEGEADWPRLHELTFQGVQFSEKGKMAFAKLTGPDMVELPFNWTLEDFRRYPEGAAPYGYSMVVSGELKGSKRWGQYRDSPLWRIEPSNVSLEELAPVLRLYKSAQQQMQEDQAKQFREEIQESNDR